MQALVEAIEIVEAKATERGLHVWDHQRYKSAKNASEYVARCGGKRTKRGRKLLHDAKEWLDWEAQGKIVNLEACALVHYVVMRGGKLYDANGG